MEYKTLENGLKLPVLVFGVYQITDSKEAIQSVKDAIKSGYRHSFCIHERKRSWTSNTRN